MLRGRQVRASVVPHLGALEQLGFLARSMCFEGSNTCTSRPNPASRTIREREITQAVVGTGTLCRARSLRKSNSNLLQDSQDRILSAWAWTSSPWAWAQYPPASLKLMSGCACRNVAIQADQIRLRGQLHARYREHPCDLSAGIVQHISHILPVADGGSVLSNWTLRAGRGSGAAPHGTAILRRSSFSCSNFATSAISLCSACLETSLPPPEWASGAWP